MKTNLDKEIKLIERAAFEFAHNQLAPARQENDKYPQYPFFDEALKKAYKVDFFHITLPEELGGIGQGMTSLNVILDNICQEDSSLGGILFTNYAAQEIILAAEGKGILKNLADTDDVKKFLIAFPSFNNPSEIAHIAEAQNKSGQYLISGPLEYVVLGSIADKALIPAKLKGQDSYSYFLIDLNESGVNKSEVIPSLGLHACPAVDLNLDNVNGVLIGKEGEGKKYFRKMSDKMYVAAAAMSNGIMKGSFKEAFAFSKKRHQGGQHIIHWSEVKMRLANMAVKINIADMIVEKASDAVDNKKIKWEACSKSAAIHVQNMACGLTSDGIQILGGVGYMKDFGQEKRFRDAKHIQALLGIAPIKIIDYFDKLYLN